MPNYCENDLYIKKSPKFLDSKLWGMIHLYLYGKSADNPDIKVREVIDEMDKNTCGILGAVIPVTDEDYPGKTHEARIELWETKWDVEIEDVNIVNVDDDGIRMMFLTAWSPPCRWAKKASEILETSIEIAYGEPGMNFSGYSSYANGEIITEEYGEYGELNTDMGTDTDEEGDTNEND